jgi:hypothetical protein
MAESKSILSIPGLRKTLDLLRYPGSDIKIIGSFADPKLKYFSDVDSQTIVETPKDFGRIKRNMQDIVSRILKDPNLVFVDFKGGFVSGKPLKWTPVEVFTGYVLTSTGTMKLEDVFSQTSIIKIDVALWLPSKEEFLEVTVNYYFMYPDGGATFKIESEETMKSRMLWDYQNIKEKDFFKALKRLYSFYKFTDNEPGQKRLLRILNSESGKKSLRISKLKTLIELLKLDVPPTNRILKSLPPGYKNLKVPKILEKLQERVEVETENLSHEARERLLAEN